MENSDNCPVVTPCPTGYIMCPDGTCSDHQLLCYLPPVCPPMSIRCLDGSCRDAENLEENRIALFGEKPEVEKCVLQKMEDKDEENISPPCSCSNKQYLFCGDQCSLECPFWRLHYEECMEKYNEILREECIDEYDFYPCPPLLINHDYISFSKHVCLSEAPVLCPDGSCVVMSGDCSDNTECLSEQIQCPDGTCSFSLADCPTPITCPSSRPFLCPDNTCHSSQDDCVDLEKCPSDKPFRCPDTSCSATRYECPLSITCNSTAPIRCEDNQCYPNSPTVCTNIDTSQCPLGRYRCWDNTCRISKDLCSERTCPLHLPFMCDDSRCVASQEDCTSSCENSVACKLPIQLGESQQQYEIRCCDDMTLEECCDYPQSDEACEEGEVRCDDGVCRAEEECVNGVSCPPDYPYRCNNECVSDPIQCLAKPVCDNGWVRCSNGMCSPSYSECKIMNMRTTFCPYDRPVLCADHSCATTLEEVGFIICSSLVSCHRCMSFKSTLSL